MKNIGLLVMLFFLSGCPKLLKGQIQNLSSSPIVVHIYQVDHGATKIPSSTEMNIVWFPGCVTVIEDEVQFFYDGNVLYQTKDGNLLSKPVKMIYEKGQLLYKDPIAEKWKKFEKMATCKNA